MSSEKKSDSISLGMMDARCSKCNHVGPLYVNSENFARVIGKGAGMLFGFVLLKWGFIYTVIVFFVGLALGVWGCE